MLQQLFAPQLVVLYILVASTLYVHFRGRERLRIARQLGDHSTYLAPYNVLMYAGSAVPNQPVIPVERFPELAKLGENWQTIREEAVRLFDEGFIRAAAKNNDWGFYSFFKSGWKRFYLKWYDDFLPSARTLCPKTVELLNSIPTVHGAMFAMLPPGGKLGAHRDPFAGSLAIIWASSRPIRTNAVSWSMACSASGATARRSCSTRLLFTAPRIPPTSIASSCSATSNVR
jgi:beta-hydroxylase